jgi:hypothetical protein
VRRDRRDPGACPICGTPHCACGPGGPITVVQLPMRDAAAGDVAAPALVLTSAGGGPEVMTPLGDGADGRPFSTATYRGTKKGAR